MDRRLLSFGLAGLIIVLDRVTKMWIEKSLTLWDSFTVVPGFFDIVHSQNRGMAFGLMNDSDSPWRGVMLVGVASAVLLVVAFMIWRMPRPALSHQRLAPFSLGLILGGAVGNVYDRILRGSVTDFLDFYIGTAVYLGSQFRKGLAGLYYKRL